MYTLRCYHSRRHLEVEQAVTNPRSCEHNYRMMRSGGRKVFRCILCGYLRPVRPKFDPTRMK